jgi:hypothetical protein
MSRGTPVGGFDKTKAEKIPLTSDELQHPNFRVGQ